MLVFRSVMVTVTPGSARPDWSVTLPSNSPFTACACSAGGHPSSTAAPTARIHL